MTGDDPVVQRVREARRRIVERCGSDSRKIYEWARKMEELYADRLLSRDELKRSDKNPTSR